MIELKEVTKEYYTKSGTLTAVDNLSLSIKEGEIFGVIGYSGAGKSTLLRMLNGLEKPTTGEIVLQDKAVNQLKGVDLRKERQKIGMIFQHFNLLWSRTVKENIEFPLEIARISKKERSKKAEELIRLVGLEGRENAYPSQLSGGQKQRVGIARALANNPKVLLCDEATSSLDPKTTDDVLELLLDINRKLNLTIVLITHEMNVVRKICDRVAVMDSGKVVEEGSVMDVFRHPKEAITEQFIKEDIDLTEKESQKFLSELKERYPEGKLVRLVYQGEVTRKPFISQLSRDFQLNINIIHGTIQDSQDIPIGTLVVQILGKEKSIRTALETLHDQKIEVEGLERD